MDIVERILDFNGQNQKGRGLKILTPDQMISRLLITLAQLKVGNISEKVKKETRQLLYSLLLPKRSIIIWSILFKDGSNHYEHWKQQDKWTS